MEDLLCAGVILQLELDLNFVGASLASKVHLKKIINWPTLINPIVGICALIISFKLFLSFYQIMLLNNLLLWALSILFYFPPHCGPVAICLGVFWAQLSRLPSSLQLMLGWLIFIYFDVGRGCFSIILDQIGSHVVQQGRWLMQFFILLPGFCYYFLSFFSCVFGLIFLCRQCKGGFFQPFPPQQSLIKNINL